MRSSPTFGVSAGMCRRVATALSQTLALAVILLAVLSVGGGQAAAQGTIITRDLTFNALGSGTLCTIGEDGTETCSAATLSVSPGKFNGSTLACLTLTTEASDGDFQEQGCAEIPASFAMDLDELGWATLDPTEITLTAWVCGGKGGSCDILPTRTIVIAASWTATGELVRVNETLGDTHGPCATNAKIDGFTRDAAATVTIDDSTSAWWGNLQSLDDKTQSRTNCGGA